MSSCNVFPVKYYKDEGFVEHKIEINEEDLEQIIDEYLMRHADFDFDEVEIVNNRPMNVWLYAKCRKYVDPDEPKDVQVTDANMKSYKYGANKPGTYVTGPGPSFNSDMAGYPVAIGLLTVRSYKMG